MQAHCPSITLCAAAPTQARAMALRTTSATTRLMATLAARTMTPAAPTPQTSTGSAKSTTSTASFCPRLTTPTVTSLHRRATAAARLTAPPAGLTMMSARRTTTCRRSSTPTTMQTTTTALRTTTAHATSTPHQLLPWSTGPRRSLCHPTPTTRTASQMTTCRRLSLTMGQTTTTALQTTTSHATLLPHQLLPRSTVQRRFLCHPTSPLRHRRRQTRCAMRCELQLRGARLRTARLLRSRPSCTLVLLRHTPLFGLVVALVGWKPVPPVRATLALSKTTFANPICQLHAVAVISDMSCTSCVFLPTALLHACTTTACFIESSMHYSLDANH